VRGNVWAQALEERVCYGRTDILGLTQGHRKCGGKLCTRGGKSCEVAKKSRVIDQIEISSGGKKVWERECWEIVKKMFVIMWRCGHETKTRGERDRGSEGCSIEGGYPRRLWA
jgi:hypothetical protein